MQPLLWAVVAAVLLLTALITVALRHTARRHAYQAETDPATRWLLELIAQDRADEDARYHAAA